MWEEKLSSDSLYDENGFLRLTEEQKKYAYSYSSLTFYEIIDRYVRKGFAYGLAWQFAAKDVRLRKERMEREKNNLKKD